MYAIRPPEYFPGLEFCALMIRCDRFVLADTFQYSRQTFQNRARLRNPNGWQWITIPLKGGQHGRTIKEVEIDNTVPWRGKHFRALSFNYRSTPYFEFYEDRIAALYDSDWPHLAPLTTASVHLVADLMSLDRPDVLSERGESTADPAGEELLLETDPPELSGTRLRFEEPKYLQTFEGFEPGMSILDLLFNHGPDTRSIIESGMIDSSEPRNNDVHS